MSEIWSMGRQGEVLHDPPAHREVEEDDRGPVAGQAGVEVEPDVLQLGAPCRLQAKLQQSQIAGPVRGQAAKERPHQLPDQSGESAPPHGFDHLLRVGAEPLVDLQAGPVEQLTWAKV